MKKNIKSFLFILPVIFLITSCGFSQNPPSLEDRIGVDQKIELSYEGKLTSLDTLDVYQSGTHVLETSDEGMVYMQSRTIDLNRYEGEMVLVSGQMEKGVGSSKPVLVVEKVLYVDMEKNKSERSYKNESFGFELSYPLNWNFTEEGNLLTFGLDGLDVFDITIFSDVDDLESLVAIEEDLEWTAVTVAAQKSLRLSADDYLVFYIPNPSRKKAYRFEYYFTDLDLKSEFFNVLDEIELIYTKKIQGDFCGGLQKVSCPEDYICQLSSASKYAEGICLPIGNEVESAQCPYIIPPTECAVYQVSEYGPNGCPIRYGCESSAFIDKRDLNVINDNKPSSFLDDSDSIDENSDSEPAVENDVLDDEIFNDSNDYELDAVNDESDDELALEYEVPTLKDLTYQYGNERIGFGLLMPKTWYFQNFGNLSDGYTVGFSSEEMDSVEDTLIRLFVSEEEEELVFDFQTEDDLKPIAAEMKKTIILVPSE